MEGSVCASYTMTQCTMLHVQLADEPDREGSPFAEVHGLCQHCTSRKGAVCGSSMACAFLATVMGR